MAKNLVIVESPAKAKTIEGYLGSDFLVKSSFGHIRDLPKGDKAIDKENNFQPTYEISKDKKDVVKELNKLAKEAEVVWLATDDDREGEAISWHLSEALNLTNKDTKRIVFREITKNAILNAIQSPRGIDIDLVNAQQARRVLDRLVGFELSPILWKKIKRGLSAGRVQSVAVRMVVERERSIDQFNSTSYFKIVAEFLVDKSKILKAELPKKYDQENDAKAFLEACSDAVFSIKNLEKKPSTKKPAAPFTTSTLQQEASRKLGFSVSRTMTIAQKLYESGKITYMRTDSVNLSDSAISAASEEITSQYGSEYVKNRKFSTKSENAQEAHEAIRPTSFATHTAGKDRDEERLYELIWKRAIASQMEEAKIERTIATISISTLPEEFKATGEVIVFDGFLKVYLESTDDDEEEEDADSKSMLPPLSIGQELVPNFINATERFTRPPSRFTEASLVKKLEEMGIGRPSTYAPTISTIQKREYVTKEFRDGKERHYRFLQLKSNQISETTKTEITGADKGKLFPTNTAMVVNDFLVKNFPTVTDYSFTASIEKEFDEIATGNKVWKNMISEFYGSFHEKVDSAENISREEAGSSKELGKHPDSGLTVLVRIGRFGPMVQIGTPEELGEDKKPQYASLLKGQLMETISLEDALELFKLPRIVGEFEEMNVTAAIGRFGPYIRHNNKFVSIPKDEDPHTISIEKAIEMIETKRKEEAAKTIKLFDENEDVQILNGRYGPYIKVGKKNVKIPKDKKPEELTLAECLELAEKQPDKKGRGKTAAKKKPAVKKTTTKKKK